MRMRLCLIAAVLLLACPRTRTTTMNISSPAFKDNGTIPAKYGCSGTGVSPPLAFSGVPSGAKSLALLVDDPDAPGGAFIHWMVWNIPPATTSVSEGQPPQGGSEGRNGFGKTGWGGPCPPSGTHHYIFNLYALDSTPDLPPTASRSDFESAMKGHIVGQGKLTGTYAK